MLRTYSELKHIRSFEDRYEYLRLSSAVGTSTFGFDRYLNQLFYTSTQWRLVRQFVIARDFGFDLGAEDHPISGRVIIHHMNPLTLEDVANDSESNLDPEFLITTSHGTHNAIHYGDASLLPSTYVERRPGDTLLW
jgi:hypothetical protein